jgi:hypothetical protein
MVKYNEIRKAGFYGRRPKNPKGLGFENRNEFTEFLDDYFLRTNLNTYESIKELKDDIIIILQGDEERREKLKGIKTANKEMGQYTVDLDRERFDGTFREMEFNATSDTRANSVDELLNTMRFIAEMNNISEEKTSIILRFTNADGINNFKTLYLDQFEEDFRDLAKGGTTHGSDGANVDTGNLDFEWFRFFITIVDDIEGGDKNKITKSKKYLLKNYKSTDNNCLIANVRGCLKDTYKMKFETTAQIRKKLKKRLGYGERIKLTKIKYVEDYFKCKILVKNDNTILYDSDYKSEITIEIFYNENHYSLITKNNLNEEEKKEKKKNIALKKKKGKKIRKKKFLFFDFETIFQKKKDYFLKVYSASWFVYDPENEFKYEEKHFEETRFEIENPVKKLLKFINNRPTDTDYLLIGFNNSRFDNFLLASEASKTGRLAQPFYVNNSLLNMSIDGCKSFDLCRFLNSSLMKACKDFKSNPAKMEGFSHLIPQKQYEEGKLNKWLEDNYELIEKYNKFDVLSLCDLMMKTRKAVMKLTGLKLEGYSTIGEMGYKHFDKNKKYDIPAPKNVEDDKFIREALTAGRTQAYFGKLIYEAKVRMTDAKSLYPYVMMNREYPIGEYTNTKKYIKGKLGIYRCKIIHQNLKWGNKKVVEFQKRNKQFQKKYAPIIYPLRARKEDDERDQTIPLNWEHRGEMKANLTTVDIEAIREAGGKVKTYEGIYWKQSANDLFDGYLKPFMDGKNAEDKLKAEGKEYNTALRELCKLFSNSLSGKVIQKNYDDSYQQIKNPAELIKFMERVKNKSFKIYKHGNGLFFVEGKLKEKLVYNPKRAKPSYLGVFIYSYARDYMYKTVLQNYTTIYEDTDSALLPLEEYERFEKENNDNIANGKYGCFEEEVGEATKCITISPKCYCVINEKNPHMSKYKFKGVGRFDKYMTETEYKKLFGEVKLTRDQIDKILNYGENKDIVKKALSYEMFESLYNGEKLYILQSQLKKHKGVDLVIKSSKKLKDYEETTEFGIQQVFMVKRI